MSEYKFGGFALGNKIRAFDFEPIEGRPDRFIEGTIQFIDFSLIERPYAYYAVKCSHDTHGKRAGDLVFVPMETWTDWDGRVVKL